MVRQLFEVPPKVDVRAEIDKQWDRIKPHTDFGGPTQSGLIKMMAIGLGNQEHETAIVKLILPDELEAVEMALLKEVAEYMPKLPLDEIDLLIIDQMGKDISGAGVDPSAGFAGLHPAAGNRCRCAIGIRKV
jgi:hypothetical protein